MSGGAAGHARSKPDACSVIWDGAQASALGTAAQATFWVALEQSGPWGREAATQSHLDPGLGLALDRHCRDQGGRLILIRRPGVHPNVPEGGPHRVYLAGGLGDRPWLLEADLDQADQLLRLPWDLLHESGRNTDDQTTIQETIRALLPEFAQSAGPVLMVCANSRRDICCAVRGRPVALESSARRPGQVWECSHTGGHRFAPTAILLPHGQTLARLSPALAVAALDAAAHGELPEVLRGPAHDRGRSHLTPPAQAAESVVRQQIDEPSLLALATTSAAHPSQDNAWLCQVTHVDGRHWEVAAVRSPGGQDRPESCGKSAVPSWQWDCAVG